MLGTMALTAGQPGMFAAKNVPCLPVIESLDPSLAPIDQSSLFTFVAWMAPATLSPLLCLEAAMVALLLVNALTQRKVTIQAKVLCHLAPGLVAAVAVFDPF